MTWSFEERLAFSNGERGKRDAEILRNAIPNCVDVRKTDDETDRKGIDYIATLSGEAEIGIDVKARGKGYSRYWRNGHEDLMLEVWSVYPDENNEGKIGWTLSDKTNVDMILFTFDEEDSENYYLLPYQLLRMAFQKHGREWVKRYGLQEATSSTKKQPNKIWRSQAVFVPVNEVLRAITQEMQGQTKEYTMKEG